MTDSPRHRLACEFRPLYRQTQRLAYVMLGHPLRAIKRLERCRDPSVFGQTYCPQALMGQMNGSYYYNCQICTACTNTQLASNFYFHCIEAVHKDYPNMPLRIGQELDGDTPIPAGMNIQTITATRTKGTGHYHRLKAGNRHFDVLSVNDLGNQ